jgi:porin
MPPFSESPISIHSTFRQGLFSQGLALRGILQGQFAENALAAPVPADAQVYVGQREFGGLMDNWTLTSDLRQLHLRHAQLYICGAYDWVSWRPAGPKSTQIYGLYYYQSFLNRGMEIKAGYVGNNLEVIGLTVGGSTATGAQGVYAVLPFELGLSYFPLTAPSFNVRLAGPAHTYFKGVAQRSLDPAGGPAEVVRNQTGLRFDPKGDKLLSFGELGEQRAATTTAHDLWVRLGYMRNSTPYLNLNNGTKEPGNSSAFLLADYQATKPDTANPENGLYAGASAMTASSRFNPFDRYYEVRLYDKAPFRSRPGDQVSLVAAYSGHSHCLTNVLVASGKTVWRNSPSVTSSYAYRVAPGQYLNVGLTYIRGAAITPRVKDAMTFSAIYSVFF